ncbi:hypothetical protein MauCBS54593_004562 [Microsporum audouinii]
MGWPASLLPSETQRGSDMAIDEEPPARFRKPGDPFTTRETAIKESKHQGGVLGHVIEKAKGIGYHS